MIGATVRQGSGRLGLRLASGVVLATLAIGAVVAGHPYFEAVIALFGAAMGWEWFCISTGKRFGAAAAILMAVPIVVAWCAGTGNYGSAMIVIAAGGALAAGFGRGLAGWLFAGAGYVGLSCLALLWLASDPGNGRSLLIWMFLLVWATDIGAYAIGRAVGGPKLASRISPNKTWAGLVGGMAAAAAVGGVSAWALGLGAPVWLAAGAAFVLAVVEQGGDLAESAMKRHFGVKDSSGLIPGHGGVMDRVDGLVVVAMALALLRIAGLLVL